MKCEAVIFDLDGTLLNTLTDLTNAVNAALKAGGLKERTQEEIRQFVGNGIVKLMERAVPGGRENAAFDFMLDEFRAYYKEHCEENTEPYDGVVEMLHCLKKRGVRMAVVSNKADFAVQELIPVYFGKYIKVAHGENETVGIRKKPAPDMVFQALRELECPPDRAVYVGDSDVDVQTAQNAGLPCIGVGWGFKGRDFLEKIGTKIVIDRPEELVFHVSRNDEL